MLQFFEKGFFFPKNLFESESIENQTRQHLADKNRENIFIYYYILCHPPWLGDEKNFTCEDPPQTVFPSFLVAFLMIWFNEIYTSFCNFHPSYLFWFLYLHFNNRYQRVPGAQLVQGVFNQYITTSKGRRSTKNILFSENCILTWKVLSLRVKGKAWGNLVFGMLVFFTSCNMWNMFKINNKDIRIRKAKNKVNNKEEEWHFL